MKRIAVMVVLALGVYLVPVAIAQNHGEIGVYADYLRPSPPDTNNFGVGGRVSVNVHPNVQLEGEMSYDFANSFTESFSIGGTGPGTGVVRTSRTSVRTLHGLFGPKLQTGGGAVRLFGVLKGGFVHFDFDSRPATFGTFTSSVESLRSDNLQGVFYPGGGVEFFVSIIGIRAEAGDLMYFHDGAHHNVRVAVGPTLRV